jgi:hypothetical protein
MNAVWEKSISEGFPREVLLSFVLCFLCLLCTVRAVVLLPVVLQAQAQPNSTRKI